MSQDPSDSRDIPSDDDRVVTVAREFVDVFGERAPALARVQADLADDPDMRALWCAVVARLDKPRD